MMFKHGFFPRLNRIVSKMCRLIQTENRRKLVNLKKELLRTTLYQFTYTKHDERALVSRHLFEGEVEIVACKTQAVPYASWSHITFERGISSHTAPQRAPRVPEWLVIPHVVYPLFSIFLFTRKRSNYALLSLA